MEPGWGPGGTREAEAASLPADPVIFSSGMCLLSPLPFCLSCFSILIPSSKSVWGRGSVPEGVLKAKMERQKTCWGWSSFPSPPAIQSRACFLSLIFLSLSGDRLSGSSLLSSQSS